MAVCSKLRWLHVCASAQCSVPRRTVVVLFVLASVCALGNIDNTISFRVFDTFSFHQTYINDTLWDGDESFTIWGQKVNGQGHSGTKYARNSTFWTCC